MQLLIRYGEAGREVESEWAAALHPQYTIIETASSFALALSLSTVVIYAMPRRGEIIEG